MWYVLSAIKSIFDLKRVCRWCKHKQVTKATDKDKNVKCEKCGKPIRPNNTC